MSNLAISDVAIKSLLTELDMNPWWEKWRGYFFSGSVACTLILLYLTIQGVPINCLPQSENETLLMEFSAPQANFVNGYCSKDVPWFIQFSGAILLGLDILILFFTSFWLHIPNAVDSIITFCKTRDSFNKFHLSFEEMKKLLLIEFDGKTTTKKDTKKDPSVFDICAQLCLKAPEYNIRCIYCKRNAASLCMLLVALATSIVLVVFTLTSRSDFYCVIADYILPRQFMGSRKCQCIHTSNYVITINLIGYIVTLLLQISMILYAVKNIRIEVKTTAKNKERNAKFFMKLWQKCRPFNSEVLANFIEYIFSTKFRDDARRQIGDNLCKQNRASLMIFRDLFPDDFKSLFSGAEWISAPDIEFELYHCEDCIVKANGNRNWKALVDCFTNTIEMKNGGENDKEIETLVKRLDVCFDVLDDSGESVLWHCLMKNAPRGPKLAEYLIRFSSTQIPYAHGNSSSCLVENCTHATTELIKLTKERVLSKTSVPKWRDHFSPLLNQAKENNWKNVMKGLRLIKFEEWSNECLEQAHLLVECKRWEEFWQLLGGYTLTENFAHPLQVLASGGRFFVIDRYRSNTRGWSGDFPNDNDNITQRNTIAFLSLLKNSEKISASTNITKTEKQFQSCYQRSKGFPRRLFASAKLAKFFEESLYSISNYNNPDICEIVRNWNVAYMWSELERFIKFALDSKNWELFILLLSRTNDLDEKYSSLEDLNICFDDLGNNDKYNCKSSVLYFAFNENADERMIHVGLILIRVSKPQIPYVHHNEKSYDPYNYLKTSKNITEESLADLRKKIDIAKKKCLLNPFHSLDTEFCTLQKSLKKGDDCDIASSLEKPTMKLSLWTHEAISLACLLMERKMWGELISLTSKFVVTESQKRLYSEIEIVDHPGIFQDEDDHNSQSSHFVPAALCLAMTVFNSPLESSASKVIQKSMVLLKEQHSEKLPNEFPDELISTVLTPTTVRKRDRPIVFMISPKIMLGEKDVNTWFTSIAQVCAHSLRLNPKYSMVQSTKQNLFTYFFLQLSRCREVDHSLLSDAFKQATNAVCRSSEGTSEQNAEKLNSTHILPHDFFNHNILKENFLNEFQISSEFKNIDSLESLSAFEAKALKPQILGIKIKDGNVINEMKREIKYARTSYELMATIQQNLSDKYVTYLVGSHGDFYVKCDEGNVKYVKAEGEKLPMRSEYLLLFYRKLKTGNDEHHNIELSNKTNLICSDWGDFGDKTHSIDLDFDGNPCLLPFRLSNFANNCWFNSVIQACSYAVRILEQVELMVNDQDSTLIKLLKVISNWEADSAVDGQLLKDAFYSACSSSQLQSNSQHDCAEFYEKSELAEILNSLGISTKLDLFCSKCTDREPSNSTKVVRLQLNATSIGEGFKTCLTCQKCLDKANPANTPDLLIVQLSRIVEEKKMSQDIFLDNELKIKLNDGTCASYELLAVVIHEGPNLNSGHYIAYLIISQDIAIKCNDDIVKSVALTAKEIKKIRQEAYLVFYRRKEIRSDGIEDEGDKNRQTKETNDEVGSTGQTDKSHQTATNPLLYESQCSTKEGNDDSKNVPLTEKHSKIKKNSSQIEEAELALSKKNPTLGSRTQCWTSRNDAHSEFSIEDEKGKCLSQSSSPKKRVKQKSNKNDSVIDAVEMTPLLGSQKPIEDQDNEEDVDDYAKEN